MRTAIAVVLLFIVGSVMAQYDTFLRLRDTPKSYVGQAGKFVRVKADEKTLEFTTSAGGATPTATATFTPTPSPTASPSPTSTATATATATSTPTPTPTPTPIAHGPGFSIDGAGAVIPTGNAGYYVYDGPDCTVTGWSIIAEGASPTTTIDVWKKASGTTLPTVADTIMGTKPALSTGNVKIGTCPADCVGWTTSVSYHDRFGFNIDSLTNATKLNFKIECRQ